MVAHPTYSRKCTVTRLPAARRSRAPVISDKDSSLSEAWDKGTLQIAVETLLSPVPSVSFEISMAKVVLGKGLGALISSNKPASPDGRTV